jgi:dethiobiotin synthetase
MRRLVVTGTDTGVGKTVVTAAIAGLASMAGLRVAVVKPVQTGVGAGEEADIDAIRRLSGVTDTHELARYRDPLAPATAARAQGVTATPAIQLAKQIADLDGRDLVLVEGAGGLLVRLDCEHATIVDVARQINAELLVVVPAGLGALNATALTCDVARRRGLRIAGIVIGAWPHQPDLAATTNLVDLPAYAEALLLGCMPAGSGHLAPSDFRAVARRSLAPSLGGEWQRSTDVTRRDRVPERVASRTPPRRDG